MTAVGTFYITQNRRKEAEQLCSVAGELCHNIQSDHPDLLLNLYRVAVICFGLGRTEDAASTLNVLVETRDTQQQKEEAMRTESSFREVYIQLGMVDGLASFEKLLPPVNDKHGGL